MSDGIVKKAPRSLRNTVHGRFLTAYIPAVLIVIAVFIGIFEYVTYTTAHAELLGKLDRLGANLSVVLAERVARGEQNLIQTVVANAINDPDITEISVVDTKGATIVHMARDLGTDSPDLVFDKTLYIGAGETHIGVGRLIVSMTEMRLRAALLERLSFGAGLSIMLLSAIVVVGSFVYRRVIGDPLNQLVDVINETDQGKGGRRILPIRDDEVGDVFRAFNRMRDRQHRNEVELDAARAGLERRVLERTAELKRAHDEALAANRAKSQFLANMSHELRTPLNSIIGFAELLTNNVIEDAERRRGYTNDIRESGVHLLSLINDLLDLSKAEAGKPELQETVLDIRNAVRSSVEMVRAAAEEKKLKISLDLPAAAPALRGDERKVRQMVLNLLSNSVKFTPEKGTIEVACRPTPDGGLNVIVTDTGVGIAEKDLERVLRPFVQVDSTYTRTHTGTGLGLPLVRMLTELHGGRFDLRSMPGKGTTCTIHFPPERVHYDARMAKIA